MRAAFELVADGMTIEAARHTLRLTTRARGVTFFNSRDGCTKMMRNRVYLGEVFLKSWRDEPST